MVVERGSSGLTMRIDAPYHGDPAPAGPAGPTPALWNHEVVELFVLGPDDRYTEVELGPSGHHLVLTLDGYRNTTADRLPLVFESRIMGDRWQGEAHLAAEHLPPRPWRLNAYAIHGTQTDRRHLAAWPVPGPAPDFHRLAFFQPWHADDPGSVEAR